MRASVFIATSLDGFIARRNGDVSWLGEPPEDGEDYGFAAFMASVDYLVMGRNTFDVVRSFGEWPYTKPVVVLTHRPLAIPAVLSSKVEAMSGEPSEVVETLHARGAKHLYIDGGLTIRAFLAAGLIQRITIAVIPILLGDGVPLFGALPHDFRLRLVDSRKIGAGIVQSEYEVE